MYAIRSYYAVASYQVGNGPSKTEIPVTAFDDTNQLSTTLTLTGSPESALVGDLYCFDPTTTTDPTTGLSQTSLTDCDISLLANMTLTSSSTAVGCELGDVNTFGSSPYRHFKCTPSSTLTGSPVSFNINVGNVPADHTVYRNNFV